MRKNIFTLVFGLLVSAHFLHANELCGDRLFTISTSSQDGVAVGDLLSQLAAECGYSMLVQDRAAIKISYQKVLLQ